MLTIWTDKIKHSTVGSSFRVTFSVAPNELEYLNKLYDCFNPMKMSSFPITADRKTEPSSSEKPNNSTSSKMEQVETMSCQECKHFHENAVMYLDQCDFCFKDCKYEPKTERSE